LSVESYDRHYAYNITIIYFDFIPFSHVNIIVNAKGVFCKMFNIAVSENKHW